MIQNAIRALRLDGDLYASVAGNGRHTIQALIIVVGATFVATAGEWLGAAEGSVSGVIRQLAGGVITWLIWTAVTFIVGRRLFGGTARFGEIARVLGFATLPKVLFFLGGFGSFVGGVWMLVAASVGAKRTLGFSIFAGTATIVIGLIPAAFITYLITGIL